MNNDHKRSKLSSILALKCARCHTGDLFPTGSFSFNKPFDMYEKCPHCGLDYEPEPGFYFGAMFISYIISGWFCILFILFFHWVLDWSLNASFAVLLAILAIIFVWFFRFSRSVWLHIVTKYDPSKV
ncbi:DUF983 domain-containing protein [Flavilitoribacter nigricans]|uniref:DUF983 domain-containing protein n=1 Tax=Flavilitoribacter nigricans (strain ATCC 23147 / DSM 23189 / NBRC 102662 / NCIMB 1420 / SS-2) TaxID=1122177 RepID=A0A2D0N876_FLAN2|nr:DUF983 domain-containing protein [Flavilitoribacter nigricans]PHN04677.1 DUF983 domain-containing protein [Flavilitoribacter nigricans DSM 23189 = NBRC 102662]